MKAMFVAAGIITILGSHRWLEQQLFYAGTQQENQWKNTQAAIKYT
jgi:hypothetical protein